MVQIVNALLFLLFLGSAMFFGLFPHSQHCAVFEYLNFSQCPPHWFHVYVLGLGSFAGALFMRNGTAGFLEFVLKSVNYVFQRLKKDN